MIAIATLVEVTPQQLADQFVTAFEGGSTYWLHRARALPDTKAKAVEKPWYSCPKVFDGAYAIELTYDNPEAGSDTAGKTITEADVMKGLKIMAEKYPHHFADLTSENDGDATTGDVFLQCAVFGEVVFG